MGLPECLRIPIAAVRVAAIEKYVGPPVQRLLGRSSAPLAALVGPHSREMCVDESVSLWVQPEAHLHRERLHAIRQVWVHVDCEQYRSAYQRLGIPPKAEGDVLDHVQNRKAIRLRDCSHPYLRLCPVSADVNTSGGVNMVVRARKKSSCIREPRRRTVSRIDLAGGRIK